MIPVHMSGAGNLFLLIDERNDSPLTLTPVAVRSVIEQNQRTDGLNIEGLLVVHKVGTHSIQASYFNPDGSFGMMCGNGARCIVKFAADNGLSGNQESILTLNHKDYAVRLVGDENVSVRFAPPISEQVYLPGAINGVGVEVYYADVNSDHVVIGGPIDESRPEVQILRHHPLFPRGTNVSMATVVGRDLIQLATFERGVEAVTGACGTGALCTALAFWRKGLVGNSVRLIPPSGRHLTVTIEHDADVVRWLYLEGDAQYDNN